MAVRALPELRTDRISVCVATADPLSRAGTIAQLRGAAGIVLVDEEELDEGAVALVVADEVDPETARTIRSLRRRGVDKVALLVTRLDDNGLLIAVEAGVGGVLRRSTATPHNLVAAIRAVAAGEGALPPDLLGRLLEQVGHLQRQRACAARPDLLRPDRARGVGAAPARRRPRHRRGRPARSSTRSARSRTSFMTSPAGSTCATGRTPSPTPSNRA